MKVSRRAFVHGPAQVSIKGKSVILPNCHIRGDLAPIRIGRYCFVNSGSILRPSFVEEARTLEQSQNRPGGDADKGESTSLSLARTGIFIPLQIGNHSRIGKNCVIEAASIGSSVIIGDNCVLGKRVIIKDCVWIDDFTVIPPDMVIPPFSRVSGCPGQIMTDSLPESSAVEFVQECLDLYSRALAKK